MPKIMLHDDAARKALGRGVAQSPKAVRGTLGPRGMNAIMDRPVGTPIISRDGVSIAAEVELEDPFENMGAQVVREVSMKTNEVVGDGTTTATVLADAIIQQGLAALDAGANPVELVRGLELGRRMDHRGVARARPSRCPAPKNCKPSRASPPTMPRSARWWPRRWSARARRHRQRRIRQHGRNDAGSRRRHGVRPRLSVAPHGDRCRAHAGGAGRSVHSDDRPEDANPGSGRGDPAIIGGQRPPAADHRRGSRARLRDQHCLCRHEKGGPSVAAIHPPEYGHWRKSMLEDIAIATGGRVIARDLGGKLEKRHRARSRLRPPGAHFRPKTVITAGNGDPGRKSRRAGNR